MQNQPNIEDSTDAFGTRSNQTNFDDDLSFASPTPAQPFDEPYRDEVSVELKTGSDEMVKLSPGSSTTAATVRSGESHSERPNPSTVNPTSTEIQQAPTAVEEAPQGATMDEGAIQRPQERVAGHHKQARSLGVEEVAHTAKNDSCRGSGVESGEITSLTQPSSASSDASEKIEVPGIQGPDLPPQNTASRPIDTAATQSSGKDFQIGLGGDGPRRPGSAEGASGGPSSQAGGSSMDWSESEGDSSGGMDEDRGETSGTLWQQAAGGIEEGNVSEEAQRVKGETSLPFLHTLNSLSPPNEPMQTTFSSGA
jgi:hypothetical protein